jgi:hypothetical protein
LRRLFRLRVIKFVPVWISLGLSGLGLWMPRGGGKPNLSAFLAFVAAYLAGLVVIVNRCAR